MQETNNISIAKKIKHTTKALKKFKKLRDPISFHALAEEKNILTNERKVLIDEKNALTDESIALIDEKNALNAENKALRAENFEKDERIYELKVENEQFHQEKTELQNDYLQSQQRATELEARNTQLQQQLNHIQSNPLNERANRLEQENSRLNERINQLEQEKTLLRHHIRHPLWEKYGGEMRKHIKTVKDPVKKQALETYANGLKQAVTDEEFTHALNAIEPFAREEITKNTGIGNFFNLSSKTSKLPSKVQEEVRKTCPTMTNLWREKI